MLKNVTELLMKARAQGYCIPAVRVVNPSGLIWCFEAAHQMNAPVIALCDSRYIPQTDAAEYAHIQDKRYPHAQLALVVDGIKTVAQAAEALRAGATGLYLAEDAEKPDEILRLARAWGIGVEAAAHVSQKADVIVVEKDAASVATQLVGVDLPDPADGKYINALREAGVCQVNVDYTSAMAQTIEDTLADKTVKPRFLLAELDVRMKKSIASEIVALMHLLGCRSRNAS